MMAKGDTKSGGARRCGDVGGESWRPGIGWGSSGMIAGVANGWRRPYQRQVTHPQQEERRDDRTAMHLGFGGPSFW